MKKTKWTFWLTEYLPEEIQNTNLKLYVHFYAHHSIIYNRQDMEAT